MLFSQVTSLKPVGEPILRILQPAWPLAIVQKIIFPRSTNKPSGLIQGYCLVEFPLLCFCIPSIYFALFSSTCLLLSLGTFSTFCLEWTQAQFTDCIPFLHQNKVCTVCAGFKPEQKGKKGTECDHKTASEYLLECDVINKYNLSNSLPS